MLWLIVRILSFWYYRRDQEKWLTGKEENSLGDWVILALGGIILLAVVFFVVALVIGIVLSVTVTEGE